MKGLIFKKQLSKLVQEQYEELSGLEVYWKWTKTS